MEITAEVIHQEFFSAGEKALQEAKNILAKPSPDNSRAKRLEKLGFGTAKDCREINDHETLWKNSKELIDTILYFQSHYPNNKFITPEAVKEICAKYGLLLGDAAKYTGEIPEKNLVDIENFKLRDCDIPEKSAYDYIAGIWDSIHREPILRFGQRRASPDRDLFSNFALMIPKGPAIIDEPKKYESSDNSWLKAAEEQARRQINNDLLALQVPVYGETTVNKKDKAPSFKICAPERDFDTRGWEIREGHILVWDPVVLQPVKNGYLIITAWGPEAKDELVVNQKLN